MGYRIVTTDQLGAVWTRLKSGESNRAIAQALSFDKKTVNQIAHFIMAAGIPEGASLAEALGLLSTLDMGNRRPAPVFAVLEPFEAEIRALIAGDRILGKPPMKAKTAWIVLRDRHGLSGKASYETFKRIVRERRLGTHGNEATSRIETASGDEIQIDYGQMGTWPVAGRNRVVYAYLGILAWARLPFVRFCTSQDQVSFAESTVKMLTFYGGSPKRLNLDNLKSGVLKANIHDPVLNRTFAELCDYYGVLADPARPAAPKDKGKVERSVPVVRELWKRLTALHPAATLDELNVLAEAWCREEYGRNRHGTTGIAPMDAFESMERSCLRPLPSAPFEPAGWSVATVAPDQFIVVAKKLFGLPAPLIGKRVDVRSTPRLIEIFFEHKKIRSFVTSGKKRDFLPQDFPEYAQPFVPGAYSSWLRGRADRLSPQIAAYIALILSPGGNLANRRADGCLKLLEQHHALPGLSHAIGIAIAERVFIPARLSILIEDEAAQNVLHFPLSEAGKAMTRAAGYYSGSTVT